MDASKKGKRVDLTEEQLKALEVLGSVLNVEQIANYFGISKPTFYAILKRDGQAKENFERGRAKAVASVASTLLSKAKMGDNACMFFYLKTQAGWRETARIDHTSSDGTMSPVNVIEMTDENLLSMLNDDSET